METLRFTSFEDIKKYIKRILDDLSSVFFTKEGDDLIELSADKFTLFLQEENGFEWGDLLPDWFCKESAIKILNHFEVKLEDEGCVCHNGCNFCLMLRY